MLASIARSAIRAVPRVAARTTVAVARQPTLSSLSRRVLSTSSVLRTAAREGTEVDSDWFESAEGVTYYTTAAVNKPAPAWRCEALVNGEFKWLTSEQFKGKWLVLFFYPLDFTFVCPTEIRAFNDRASEFEALGANVVAASVDSKFSHLAWTKQPREEGGLGEMRIPILSDITKGLSRRFGVLMEEEGVALRGLFIIDPQGTLRQITINDLPVGRSVDETLRLIQAFQFHAKHGEVCPSDWKPGQEAMQTSTEGLKKFFSKKQ